MKVLATALPSTRYRWFKSLEQVRLEARLINDQVRFYEIYNGQEKCITQELVNDLFPTGCMLKDRPFLVKENKEFYAVVQRHTVKYKDQFLTLKNGGKAPRKEIQLTRKPKFVLKRK